jgi:hypothetical protein
LPVLIRPSLARPGLSRQGTTTPSGRGQTSCHAPPHSK